MNILQSDLPVIKYITTNERVDFYLMGSQANIAYKVFTTQPNVRKDIDGYIKLVENISHLDKPVKGRDRLRFTDAHKELLKYKINNKGFDNTKGKLMYKDCLGLKITVE